MNSLDALIARAKTGLAGKPPWGHTLVVDLGPDGALCVSPNNQISRLSSSNVAADCIVTFPKGMVSLNNLLDGTETPTEEWWNSELKWTGDRSIAEQFVRIVTGKT